MMLDLYVLQNQWIAVTLMAGVGLMILLWLTYRAMWRSRKEESAKEEMKIEGVASFFRWFIGIVPWVLILIVLGCLAFTVLNLLTRSVHPPNW